MNGIEFVLLAVRLVAVALGLVFLLFTFRAFRRHRSRRLAVLLAAIVLMVLAALAEGASLEILDLSRDEAHLVESVVTLAAFATLVASVFVRARSVHRHEGPADAMPEPDA